MKQEPADLWKKLSSAARAGTPAADEAAPFGFSTRVVARWQELRREEASMKLWQRLAWRTFAGAFLLTGMVLVQDMVRPPDGPLLNAPSVDLPSPLGL